MAERVWFDPTAGLDKALPSAFEALWSALAGRLVGRNRLRRVERIETPVAGYLKRFTGIQVKNALRLLVTTHPRCRSQAFRELRVIEDLEAAGLGAPKVLLAAERTLGPWERRSLLLTAPLRGKALCEAPDGPTEEDARAAAKAYGLALRAGVFTPDMGFDHVFRDEGGRLSLLDFHNARTAPAPSPRELGRAVLRLLQSPGGARHARLDFAEELLEIYLETGGRLGAKPRAMSILKGRLAG